MECTQSSTDGQDDMTEPAPPHDEDQLTQLTNGDTSPLRNLCAELHDKVTSFLQEDLKTERLKATQEQTRRSLAVIQEALDRYEFAACSRPSPSHHH